MNDFFQKLMFLKESGKNPFAISEFIVDSSVSFIVNNFSNFNKEKLDIEKCIVKIAGRIMRFRNFGNICFSTLRCSDGDIQLVVVNDKEFINFDLGDIIGVEGMVFRTDRGELSIKVISYKLLSKCLRRIPDFHYGFNDIEERFRNRHLDLMINYQKRQILLIRAKINRLIREFLDQKDFVEIETPILVPEASGAQARPFTTHHYTLNRDFQLRIATEIPLKRLIVGGFEKVYEIGKVFRNEGIDSRHNPEFTTVEIYEAYQNSSHMMKITEDLITTIFKSLYTQNEIINFRDFRINIGNAFRRDTMLNLVREHSGIDFSQVKDFIEALDLANQNNVHLEKHQDSIGHVIVAFFEKFVEHKLIQPIFVYEYPIEVSPLSKKIKGNENFADRFELFIAGLEFANGYSELNDPIEQKERFELQAKEKSLGNIEIASFDGEFVETLFYGMPPTGGLGIGIDRLVMLFTSQNTIREVVAFPQMRKK